MNNKKYYVYAYCNPLVKRDINNYPETKGYQPFYIGKGKNDRIYKHLQPREQKRNIDKSLLIQQINEKYNVKDYIFKLYENLSEIEALNIERELVLKYKPIDLGGCLLNKQLYFNISNSAKGEQVQNSKITYENVKEIRKTFKSYSSLQEIAMKFNISSQHVANIIKNEMWYDDRYNFSIDDYTLWINKKSLKKVNEIRTTYDSFNNTDEIAKKYKICRSYVRKIIRNKVCIDNSYKFDEEKYKNWVNRKGLHTSCHCIKIKRKKNCIDNSYKFDEKKYKNWVNSKGFHTSCHGIKLLRKIFQRFRNVLNILKKNMKQQKNMC